MVDASQFNGSDVCAQIAAANASTVCQASNACKIVAPFVGINNCAASPFSGWTGGGELDLKGAGVVDLRVSATVAVPNGVQLHGIGTTNPSPASGTIIRACNPNIFSCSPAFKVQSEAVSGGVTVSLTVATVTVNNTLRTGQDVFIYGGPGPFSSYHSFVIATIGTCSPTCTGFTIPVASGTSNCFLTCSGATVYEGTPLIQLGGLPAAGKTYGVQVDHLTADCAWVPGCVAFANSASEEGSFWQHVTATNSGMQFRITEQGTAYGGTSVGVGGANNSGPYVDMTAQFLKENCELTTDSGCNGPAGPGTGNPVYEDYATGGTATASGSVTCSGFTCTWTGGSQKFNTNWTGTMAVLGAACTPCTISSVSSTTSVTFTASAAGGTAFSFALTQGVNGQNQNPLNCDAVGLSVDGTTAAANKLKTKVTDFTMTANSQSSGAVGGIPAAMDSTTCGAVYHGRAPMGVFAAGFDAHIDTFHLEYWQGDAEIGGNVSLNPEFPGAPTQNVMLSNFEVCCGGDVGSYAVDIGGAPNTVVNSGAMNWAFLSSQDMMKDNQSSKTCSGSESTEGWYLLGNTPNQLLTSCTGVTNAIGYIKSSQTIQVTGGNFTTNSTSLTTITGLTWTAPVSFASNWSFHCLIPYSVSASAMVAFGIQGATTAPTSLFAAANMFTSNGGAAAEGSKTITNTTATTLVNATQNATGTVFQATIDGTAELPLNVSPTVLNFMADVSTGTLTIERGAYCQIF